LAERDSRQSHAVTRIYPGFRGDRVTMVGNELVIVNPSSYQIVAVLPG
jgi:hypothetical protein